MPLAHAPLRPILPVCCELGSARQPPPPPQPRARTEPGSRELGTWNSKSRPSAPPTAAPAPPHPPHGLLAAGGVPALRGLDGRGVPLLQRPGPARPTSGTGERASSRERARHRAATAGRAPARGKSGKSREPAPAATSVLVPGQRGPSRPSSAALSRQEKQEPGPFGRSQAGQRAGARAAGREGERAGSQTGGPVRGAGRREAGPVRGAGRLVDLKAREGSGAVGRRRVREGAGWRAGPCAG